MTYGLSPQPDSVEVPTCARHQDRISYVRCQRCDLPACPQCQRPAAVGVQCVTCVNEAARSAPRIRTSFGGAHAPGRPLVTISLVALSLAVFALQWLAPGRTLEQAFAYAPILTSLEPWRMLTAAFLHSQTALLHIAFNMYALWQIGGALEPLLGRLRFLLLYVLSAVGGSVGVLLLSDPRVLVVGASGAVFGLFGAYVLILRQRGGDLKPFAVLMLINAALAFAFPVIAWQAHVGGFLTGALIGAILTYSTRTPKRTLVQTIGLAAVGLLLLAATAIRLTV